MKGLEFPVIFVVDLESQRFPKRNSSYEGWLPTSLMSNAIARGAYQATHDEEARLFYTAITRAERFLYLTGSENLPAGKRPCKKSPYTLRLAGPELSDDASSLPAGLVAAPPARRVNETVVPTSFSQVRYFLRCPKDYQFRNSYGFSPSITEMFGFGKTVHTAVEKLHEVYSNRPPTPNQAAAVAEQTFHLKHVAPNADPIKRPGAYERAKTKAGEILKEYATGFGTDFVRKRAVEVPFEIPLKKAVLAGAIDLLLKVDDQNQIVDATVVDFKAIEGGDDPKANDNLNWVDLALQVQLYAHAAKEVLTEHAKTGTVHLLKDNKRVEVPVTDQAISAAADNVEWAVDRIIEGDFPMRPHPDKCDSCDFNALCSKKPQNFKVGTKPLAIFVPQGREMAAAFRLFKP